MKRGKKKIAGLVCLLILAVFLCGCSGAQGAGKRTITLTIWHVYGGQSDSPLNDLIAQFNNTVGKDQGINLVVTSVSNTNAIHESVLAAVRGEPGAPTLPDLFLSYPKTVAALEDNSILADFRDYFSEEELAAYVQPFLEEGTFDGKLLIFPVAKSTELLFVNKTLFDRFASATGAKLTDLATWEGVFNTACKYADWTDAQTPGVPDDGKAFIALDYPFHYMQVGVQSMGGDFFRDEELSFCEEYEAVWAPLAQAGIRGGLWLGDGFAASDPMRTGEVITAVGSSASVLYHSKTVTYLDNTSEEVEIISLPCPAMEDGQKLVMQRGAGFCAVKSTPEKEKAASVFLRWLTRPERNTAFVTSVGYLPVTEEAYETYLEEALSGLTEPAYIDLYQTVLAMQQSYAFYAPPNMPGYLETEEKVIDSIRSMLLAARKGYLGDPERSENEWIEASYRDFVSNTQGIPLG